MNACGLYAYESQRELLHRLQTRQLRQLRRRRQKILYHFRALQTCNIRQGLKRAYFMFS